MKDIVLITMGDPNGVGPEICVRALSERQKKWAKGFRFVVVGSYKIMQEASKLVGSKTPMNLLTSLSDLPLKPKGIWVWEAGNSFKGKLTPGKIRASAGKASIDWVRESVLAVQRGEAAALTTAPLAKEAVEKGIDGFQGHTEFIGEMCGDSRPVLTLVHGDWVVSHVSTHVSLKEAVEKVQIPRILKTAHLLNEFLKKYKGISKPRIGIAGLNPHAGENGLFGREEIEVIIPAVRQLLKKKIDAKGPIPADVVFPQLKSGRFDGVVAMYHDQGHVVTKTMGFDLGKKRLLHGVNLTLGLDVIRTSVDHGTGFDIAWQGIADHHSLLDALEVAIKSL